MDQVFPLPEYQTNSSCSLDGQTGSMLFSPRSPFARLCEVPRAPLFGRSFRTQQQSPVSLHQKAPLNEVVNPRRGIHGYERRPRRKTKEDRYQYKVHDRRADPERSKKKTAKQSRKHILNRDFHAPNVSQTRLTVYADYQPFETVTDSVVARFSSEYGDIWQRTDVVASQISRL